MTIVRMTEDEIWDFLRNGHTGILATLRKDGMPIMMPIWYVTMQRRIYMYTRGKKLVRLRNDSRGSFLVEAGDRWVDLRAVHLTGIIDILDPVFELAGAVREEMDRKYLAHRIPRSSMPRETREAYETAESATLRFTPDARVLNWDNRKLGIA